MGNDLTAAENAALVIPGTDVLGVPTAPCEIIRSHWSVFVDADVQDIAGPHLLGDMDEASARRCLAWWQEHRPDAAPRLVRRRIVETYGEWEVTR